MTDMVLPQYGMGMTDGTIIAWHKSVGDYVEAGEPLCDVEAAKTTVEVGASHTGILQQILAPVGTTVPVNTVIAVIGDAAAEIPQSPPPPPPIKASKEAKEPKASSLPAKMPARPLADHPAGGQGQIEPRARRAARLHNIDLLAVQGTGPGGRIIEEDVIAHARMPVANAAAPTAVATAALHAVSQLRMRCSGAPLAHLLDELAGVNNIHVPLGAALLKAVGVAVARSGVERRPICMRLDNGSVMDVEDPLGSSLLAITSRLEAADRAEGSTAGIVIELNSESWIDEVICLDPAFPICLSFNQASSFDSGGEPVWHVTLTVQDEVLSVAQAKQFLAVLRGLFAHPLAMLV